MNDLAYLIRNDPIRNIRKEFIWSPYLGFNEQYYEINNNIGVVANRTNIFKATPQNTPKEKPCGKIPSGRA